ncbi:hypothetical protein B566_EDAN012171 [Ephemera danica]|nr:hypothetical protein B566_EDAN012171 [Ephemera danica]
MHTFVKKIIIMLHAFKYCLLLGLAGLAKSQTPIELSFIHINDLHAKYEPVSVNVGTCAQGDNELGLCYGGLSRIVTATQQLEAAHPNSILLNAGDNFQGSLLYSLFKWNITVEMMNRIPFVATALGNHEFDDKVEGVEPYMSGLISPIVAVNMDVSLEPSLAGKYLPSIVIQRGGRNIGIIGSITKYTPNMASSENVIFNDEYETVSAEATRLRSQGVDIIVLLSHSGTPPSVEVPVGEYPTVVTQSSGRTVLIVQAYCFSKYVGVLNVVFDAVGEVVSWTGVPMLLDASVPEDPATKAALQPWVDEANILGLTPLGTSAVLLTSNNCYSGECNLGNFYTDAMVAEQVDMSNLTAGWTKAALAIMNPGGIRAPLGENPNITYNDLVNSQPFGNTIDTIELQGKDIREILEMSASEFWAYEGYRDFTTGKGCMQISADFAQLTSFSMHFLTQFWFVLVATHLAIGFELNFVHINDFHAKFLPVSVSTGNCKPEDNDRGLCYGGIARIVTAIRDLQSTLPNQVLLNAGDAFQGSLLYSLFKWNITLDFMNKIPFDATFDDGVAGIEPYLSGLMSPIVAANMDVSQEPTLMGKYQPSVVIERGGRSIGIIGEPPSIEKPEGEYPTVVTQESGRKVLIVQAYAYSKYLGVLQVEFDAHGEVTSWSGAPKLLDASVPEGLCYGGIARIVTAIRDLQSTLPNPVLLNIGDTFQGSLLYSLFKWNITLDFMNRTPFDATALGNHEFDDGVAGIEPYLSGLTSPIVVVNMNVSQEPTLMGKYQPSVVIERGGRSIGIIGCITKDTPGISKTENVTFNDELETVKLEAARLRAQGVDIIVLLSHSGYRVDQTLAKNITDLDIIVGAHSHTFLYTGEPPSIEKPEGEYPTVVTQESGRKVLIVQAYAYSKYLGVLKVEFDAQGEVTSWSGAPKLLDASVPEDAETKALLQPWVEDANVLGDQPLGTSAVHLSATQCHHGECNLGNFYTDAMVSALADANSPGVWTKAALAILNPGSIRAPLGENLRMNNIDVFSRYIKSQNPIIHGIEGRIKVIMAAVLNMASIHVLLSVVLLVPAVVLTQDDPFTLSVIHINDFHARFDPVSVYSGRCLPGDNEKGLCYGGIARVVTKVNELKDSLPNPLLLNGGDTFQGTLFYSLFKWNISVEFMNRVPFDVTGIGNHEFDDGIAGAVPYFEGLNSPLVAVNMNASLEPDLQGKFYPSVVIGGDRFGNHTVGVIGCITKETSDISNSEDIIFYDELETVKAEAARLKDLGVDIIILLSHSGYDVDQELAQNVEDLDIIVGAHSHSFLYTGSPLPSVENSVGDYPTVVTQQGTNNRTVLIIQAYAYSKYVGELQVQFDEEGEILSWSGQPHLLDHTVPEDVWTGAAIGIMNPGGVRAPLGETSSILVYDLLTAQPFNNTIDTVELQGKDILAILERSAAPKSNMRRRRDLRYYDVLGFMQVSGIVIRSRVTDLKLRCSKCREPEYRPIDLEEWYYVAMPSFLSGGGDGYHMIPDNGRNFVVGDYDVNVFERYIKRETPITQGLEGRITIVE